MTEYATLNQINEVLNNLIACKEKEIEVLEREITHLRRTKRMANEDALRDWKGGLAEERTHVG